MPVLMICLGYGYFNIMDAAIKMLVDTYHYSQIMFVNCIIVVLTMGGGALLRRDYAAFRMIKPKWVLVRAILSVVCATLNIAAFPHIELATFYTLVFTAPFCIALLSTVILGERMTRMQMAAIATGFAVVVAVFQPGTGLFNIYSGFVLLSTFSYSCSMIIMRHLGPAESRTMIVGSGAVCGILAVLPMLSAHFVMPSLYDAGVFLVMGLTGTIGITAVSYAFQNAPSAATVAPYHYTQIVWGVLLGYYLFGEVPSTRLIIGAVLIVAAGLVLIFAEARKSVVSPPVL